jgi:hypothetical protein
MKFLQVEDGAWIDLEHVFRFRTGNFGGLKGHKLAIWADLNIHGDNLDKEEMVISGFHDIEEADQYLMDLLKRIQDQRIYTYYPIDEFRHLQKSREGLND